MDDFDPEPVYIINQVSYDAINWKIKITLEQEEMRVGNLSQLICLLRRPNMRVKLFSIFVPKDTNSVLQLIENLRPIRHVWQDENLRIFWPMQPNQLDAICLGKFFTDFAGGSAQLILHGGIPSFRFSDIFYCPDILLCASASRYIPLSHIIRYLFDIEGNLTRKYLLIKFHKICRKLWTFSRSN
uniref:Uncharacterized protein n=1 Tax=Ditylenchus dipsaci TaxID=166011 RepID=A0A915EQ30_9BILA